MHRKIGKLIKVVRALIQLALEIGTFRRTAERFKESFKLYPAAG